MAIINTSECEKCEHCTIDDSDKAKVKIYCSNKNKTFYYGQCIQCGDKEKIK